MFSSLENESFSRALVDQKKENHSQSIGSPFFFLYHTLVEDSAFGTGKSLAGNDDLSVVAIANFVRENELNANGPYLPLITIYKRVGGTYVPYGAINDFTTDSSLFVDDAMTEIDVSGDGSTIAIAQVFKNRSTVGTTPKSTIKVYQAPVIGDTSLTWIRIATPYEGDAGGGGLLPGLKVSLDYSGDHLLVGERYFNESGGEVSLYTRNGSAFGLRWTTYGGMSGLEIGSSVNVARDGSCFVYGAVGVNSAKGAAYVYCKNESGVWQAETTMNGNEVGSNYGFSVAITVTGDKKLVSIGAILHDSDNMENVGIVQVFCKIGDGSWFQLGSNIVGERGVSFENYHIGDTYGFSISLGDVQQDENTIRVAIGAPNNDKDDGGKEEYYHGHVELYEIVITDSISNNEWMQIAYDIDGFESGDSSGSSVNMSKDGKYIAIGSPGREEVNGISSGIVHIYFQDEYSDIPSQVPSSIPSVTLTPSVSPSVSMAPSLSPTVSLHPSFSIPINVHFFIAVTNADFTTEFLNRLKGVFQRLLGISDPNDITFELATSGTRVLAENTLAIIVSVLVAIPEDVAAAKVEKGLQSEFVQEFNDEYSVESFGVVESESPSIAPSFIPSISSTPSFVPSLAPSKLPSSIPSLSSSPSIEPSISPSIEPSSGPSASIAPSFLPSDNPSLSAKPSLLPSLVPSLSKFPSSEPSNKPSLFPSEVPSTSLAPSSKPSTSVAPSLAPSSFLDREVIIVSKFGAFSDRTENYCLTASAKVQKSGKLIMRKCDLDQQDVRERQVWKFGASGELMLAYAQVGEFCVKSTYKQLTIDGCAQDDPANENFQLSCSSEDRQCPNGGRLVQTRPNDTNFLIGIDGNRIFERLRMFREGSINQSLDKWTIIIKESWCEVENESKLGNGVCDGGNYNTFQCDYDLGDCIPFNEQYPDCEVDFPSLVGNGQCDVQNSTECGYDGGDCLPKDWVAKGSEIVGEPGDYFGYHAVSLSDDGNTLAIGSVFHDGNGAANAGRAEVFQFFNGHWIPKGFPLLGQDNDEHFGHSVSLSDDGKYLAVGAPAKNSNGEKSGQIRVYSYSSAENSWIQMGQTFNGLAALDQIGVNVSLSQNGKTLAFGSSLHDVGSGDDNSGQVRIFRFSDDENNWVLSGELNGQEIDERFGSAVSLSDDGNSIAIGATAAGATFSGLVRVYLYNSATNTWLQHGTTLLGDGPGSNFGRSVSLSGDGNTIAFGSPYFTTDSSKTNVGQIRVYSFSADSHDWVQLGRFLDGKYDWGQAGHSQTVSISDNGKTIAIGEITSSPNGIDTREGHAMVYQYSLDIQDWQQLGIDLYGIGEQDRFGHLSLSGDGSTLAVAAPQNDNNGENSGHVRVFDLQ